MIKRTFYYARVGSKIRTLIGILIKKMSADKRDKSGNCTCCEFDIDFIETIVE